MKLKRLSIGVFSLLLLVSCGGKQTNKDIGVIPEYKTATMSVQSAELETVYPVTIKGQEDIEIRPRIDGFIDDILVDEGSVVKKGQVLFVINSPQTVQDVSLAKASVDNAQAVLETAQINVEKIEPLANKGIVSEVQLKTYRNSLESAKASLNQAKATLTNAHEKMKWTKVSSPVDGVVGSISYRKGSLVNSTNVLTIVANTKNVFAYFSRNEKDLMDFLNGLEGKTQAEKIKNILPITLTLSDGTEYAEKGKIETISGSINVTTGTANFRAEFPNQNGVLRSGTSGNISIPKIINDVFLIPQKATFPQQNKILVYKVQGDSVVQSIISVVPTPDGKSYAVTGGLNQGDKIVVEGVATLSNGKKIKAI